MTLSEMADFICGKVNQTEAEDILACKGFIRRRYEVLFKDQLWKDSVVQVDVSMDPDDSNNAVGVLMLPAIVDRPLAVRSAERAIVVQPWEQYFRIDFDSFAQTGSPFEFAKLNPAWLTIRPKSDPWTAQTLTSFVFYWTLTCEVGDVFRFINDTGQDIRITSDDIVSYNHLVVAGDTFYFEAPLAELRFLYSTSPLGALMNVAKRDLGTNESVGASSTLTITSNSTEDTANIKVIWRDQTGKRYETTAALPTVTLTPDDDAGFFEIEALFKPATTGALTVTLNDASAVPITVTTLAATDKRSPAYQRIRLFRIPTATTTIKVLAKAKFEALDFDQQEPLINGVENCLLAFGQGDMLQRERQYGKAQQLYAEALQLLEQLKREETVQEAHNQRIIPEGGYGDENFTPPSPGFSF